MSKEECENADKNPICPYLTEIHKSATKLDSLEEKHIKIQSSVAVIKTDVSWLKRGYWIQIGILLTLMGLVITLVAKGG